MTMSVEQGLIIVAMVGLGTMVTRFLPFLVFSGHREKPRVVRYLSQVLPYAAMGLLLVYCFKDVAWGAAPHGLPEGIAAVVTALLQIKIGNMLLSIAIGTILYMILVQGIFVG